MLGRMISVSMRRLVTFGGLALESDDGSPPPRLRPQRLAILAVLAAGGRGVSRERLFSLFWPEADEEHARHSLRQALYALRQELGVDAVHTDSMLSLDRAEVQSDVGEFRAAMAAGDHVGAASLATGPFLDGFFLPGVAGFERWVEDERAVLVADTTRALLELARESTARGEIDAAADWWRRLTRLDPLSGRFALGYLKALAASGDRAGALAFARAHESVVRRELEADPDPDIRRLEAELRAMPSPPVVRATPASAGAVTDGVRSEIARNPAPDESPSAAPLTSPSVSGLTRSWRRLLVPASAAVVVAVLAAATADRWRPVLGLAADRPQTFAVGMIREEGVPDTLRIGGVLTDMLATNLARVAGLSVLANTRLFESMRPGQDTIAAGYAEAARRAGATELFQGRLLTGPQWGLAMEIQRVDLASGIVKGAYRVAAVDRYGLVDSMTAAIARDLRLGSPATSISEATTASPIAYRLYEEGLRALYLYDWSGAQRLMESALQEDSTFAMAAYYLALLAPGGSRETELRNRAIRLAARAPERERLTITANMLTLNLDPRAVAVAESLVTRYPNDPLALRVFAGALGYTADWRGAVAALERAVRIDSIAEPADRQSCSLCEDYIALAENYFQWDSLAAVERTAQRFARARPKNHRPYDLLAKAASARGDVNAVRIYLRALDERNVETTPLRYTARMLTLAEEYGEAERLLRQVLDSPRDADKGDASWVLAILLRNQGRLEDFLARDPPPSRRGRPPDGSELIQALVALERGDTETATAIFTARTRWDESVWAPGTEARHRSWHHTLLGIARAAAGDTLSLLRLADTVEYWGRRSLYTRDLRNARYLRGMVLVAAKHDAAAVEEFRQAIHSPTNGFTRINYELGKALLRLGRAAEAVPVVRAALHGGIDGSNLYMTRTDLHELLAQLFDRMGSRDSAAVHYRAVVKAWARADPIFHARRDHARAWLARHTASEIPRSSDR